MNIDRLNRIEEVHYAALQLPAGEREQYLCNECGTDDELRREVESLLAFADRPESLLDVPPGALAAEMFAERESAPDLIGREIGHYQITELLGSGGMGEVYLAEDTKLRRKIALKLLPPHFHADRERRRRFEKEARAISALNHPNIITIYEIENGADVNYIATEFIDGQTLRELIAEKPLRWQEAVRIAIQVADALESAHSLGIVHRDIKPGNIMVRRDGIVKVLDFGLAKLTGPDSGDFDTREQTAPHRVMGTINYMSPEQALGESIDPRTDIYSFGVVLYEMLTGKLPFARPSETAIDGATIHRSMPSVCDSNPDIPPVLGRIVKHALEKDRDVRYRSLADFRADLKSLFQDAQTNSFDHAFTRQTGRQTDANKYNSGTGSNEPVKQDRSAGRPMRWAVLALVSLLVTSTGAAVWLYSQMGRPKAALSTATSRIVPFNTFPGAADQPAFSPDGNQIAFTWDGGGKNVDIYVKLIGAGSPLRLTSNPAGEMSPAWSSDGRYVAFMRRTGDENGIFIVPALGGAERKLGQTVRTVDRPALSWSPDGRFLAVADRLGEQERFAIVLISPEDGRKQRLTSPPESSADAAPAFSPDGQTVAFIRNTGLNSEDIYFTSVRGGEPIRLTEDGQRIHSLAWTADGSEIIFSSNRGGGFSLWRVPVTGGTPERVSGTGQNAFSPAISRKGDHLVYNVAFLDSEIWRADAPRAGGRPSSPKKVVSSTRQDHSPQYSPNGKKVVFASDRSGSDEIWTCESDGSNCVQLTAFNGTSVGSPRWSPDSRQIMFDARPNGQADIFVIDAEGGKPQPLVAGPSHDVMASWSRDGKWVYFCSNRSGDFQVWKSPVSGGEAVQVTQQGGFEAYESPDGSLLYYTRDRGPSGIWQVPVAGGEERQVSELIGLGYWRYWTVMDNGIYFVPAAGTDKPAVAFFSFAARRVTPLGPIEREPLPGLPGLTVSPDGRSILYAQADQNVSDIMLVENFR